MSTPEREGIVIRLSPTLPSGSQQSGRDGLPDIPEPDGYIRPPESLQGLARLSAQNGTRKSIIEALVRNTVGLGFTIAPGDTRPELPKPVEVEVPAAPAASPVTGATPPGQPDAPKDAPTGSPNTGHAAAKPDPTGAVAPPADEPPAEPETRTVEPTPEAVAAAKDAQRAWDAAKLLDRLAAKDTVSDSPSFTGLLCMVKTDEEECGNAAIEISRNLTTAKIDGLYYAPGARVRRSQDRNAYAIIARNDEYDPDELRTFRAFGDGVEVDEETGEVVGWKEGYGHKGTNELLVFRLMSSESRDYGLPRDIALVEDYLSDYRLAETNTAFFANGGVPPTIVFLTSEAKAADGSTYEVEVPDELARNVLGTMRPSRDGYSGRVAFIPGPPGSTMTKIDLGSSTEKDIGYSSFRTALVQRQLSTFRIQPIFIATTAPGGASQTTDAEVQRSMTQEQVFSPEQARYERVITNRLLPQLGFGGLEITFTKMAIEGDAARREAADRSADAGTITNGEHRTAHGWGELPEDGARVPQGWNGELIKPKGPTQSTPTPEVMDSEDQRGQRPGVGARVPRGTENPEHPRGVAKAADPHPVHVETVAALTSEAVTDLHSRRIAEAFPARRG